jgi:DNA-directed RNA polymerase specialized sigma24 family protein
MSEFAQLMPAARKYRAAAVEPLLASYYPTARRIAYGLCGDGDAAERVLHRVFARALPALAKWRDESDADRWFYHFTVLESRRHLTNPSARDPLLPADENAPVAPPYIAFLRALRSLPPQQREAIILTHAERLNPRYLSVAMDCSAEAAANHLRVATQHLEAITGNQLTPLLETLARTYKTLSPPKEFGQLHIRRRLNRYLLPRRIRLAMWLMILSAVAWILLWWWRR